MILPYCFGFQVGTTTWLTHFSKLADHLPASGLLHKIVPAQFKVSKKVLMDGDNGYMSNKMSVLELFKRFHEKNEILSFSFVRHPFDRYVSHE